MKRKHTGTKRSSGRTIRGSIDGGNSPNSDRKGAPMLLSKLARPPKIPGAGAVDPGEAPGAMDDIACFMPSTALSVLRKSIDEG